MELFFFFKFYFDVILSIYVWKCPVCLTISTRIFCCQNCLGLFWPRFGMRLGWNVIQNPCLYLVFWVWFVIPNSFCFHTFHSNPFPPFSWSHFHSAQSHLIPSNHDYIPAFQTILLCFSYTYLHYITRQFEAK